MRTREDAGFGGHEAITAVAVLATLMLLGFGASWLFGLEGPVALVPPAGLVGGFVLFVIGANVVDAVRRRS